MKLIWIASHYIQYQAPLFRALDKMIDLEVWLLHEQSSEQQANAGYGISFDWDIDLVSGYQSRKLPNRSRKPSIDRFLGTNIDGILGHLRKAAPDFVIIGGWYLLGFVQAIAACRYLGIPVYAVTDSTPRPRGQSSFAQMAVRRALQSVITGFLSAGSRSDQYLISQGVHESRIHRLHHCVDMERFHFRQRPGITPSPDCRRKALFVGSLCHRKGVLDLLDAAKKIPPSENWQIEWAGEGELRSEVEQSACTQFTPSRILGFVNQSSLPALYARADLLVLPSRFDTWGLVVNEALACGTPVIVSDGAGCSEDLSQFSPACRTYPSGDSESLAIAIMRTPRTEEIRNEIFRFRDQYSTERAAIQVIAALTKQT